MTNENDETMEFPSTLDNILELDLVLKNINSNLPIIIKGIKWFIYSP